MPRANPPRASTSSAPGAATNVYRQLFLPFREAVAVGRGDRLRVRLSLRLAAGEYVWAWTAWISPASGGPERQVAKQNSLAEGIVDPARLTPGSMMPSYYRTEGLQRVAPSYRGEPLLGAQQVEDVVAYLRTLR